MPGEMQTKGPNGFFPGRSLPEEIGRAMNRLARYGVAYPEGYYQDLVEKYTRRGIPYPHILIILGIPRINHHAFYRSALARPGRLLDYGCGTGDNVRQLLRDGFPREQISAFDIGRESVDLGFDLYRDRPAMEDLFVISEKFPFGNNGFEYTYSASVIHVIRNEREYRTYLANAYSALRPGGVFFGSTLGLKEGAARSPGARGPPRILTPEQLESDLTGAGFIRPEIKRRNGVPGYVPGSEELCALEFCTRR